MPNDDEFDWHDQQSLIVSGGVAALILVAILIYAVIRTSDASHAPVTVQTPASSQTPSTYTTSSSTTTSYTVPRVQTSQDNPIPPGGPPAPTPQEGPATSSEEQTLTNPYSTTTPPNAGHV